ncbi:Uncharacterized protein OS=Planctomyces maris DSM 8797 GN=PM8797T_09849 PE=4 SV=1 [Gemmataceae bacterium]|nr:Uncharacterized protein OS=Planctomyces maris DSM 8797 GN=PM8797T_09849 PE=4 SV=1 [Gemmataceae bacterium]VTT97462.1 Uncharacterized protein OS=Planctomyces maris DSM 8797 GN=PM8797T_09849 PE=4 SV=1 [Gemmataceae bacterium]
MTDKQFLSAFESATLERAEWTHEAHVRLAWLYLSKYPVADALEKVRGGIRRLNQAFASAGAAPCRPVDAQNPPGYHDTITVAFVRVIAGRLGAGEKYEAFRERNADLFDRSLSAIRKHYTKKVLFSAKARKGFVEANRAPLPAVGPWGAEPQTGVAPAARGRTKSRAVTATSA